MHTTKENDPVLSREEALAILNTPDDQLDDLIARAEKLRRKYKGNQNSSSFKNDISSLHGFQMEKEKGKGNCVGILGNKKSFVSLTYARRRSFQKTLRVTTSNYRLFLWGAL